MLEDVTRWEISIMILTYLRERRHFHLYLQRMASEKDKMSHLLYHNKTCCVPTFQSDCNHTIQSHWECFHSVSFIDILLILTIIIIKYGSKTTLVKLVVVVRDHCKRWSWHVYQPNIGAAGSIKKQRGWEQALGVSLPMPDYTQTLVPRDIRVWCLLFSELGLLSGWNLDHMHR